jgi:hypothetical protein
MEIAQPVRSRLRRLLLGRGGRKRVVGWRGYVPDLMGERALLRNQKRYDE